MTEELNKLHPNDVIARITRCINTNDVSSFYNIVQEYANGLAISNKQRWSIVNALKQKPVRQLRLLSELSSNVKKLIIPSEYSDEPVYLNEEIESLINELLSEWGNIPLFQYHNIKVRNKILFTGSTGNGKTTIARHIAKLANLPFIEVKFDDVIDSKLGQTGSNIFLIFNEIKEPCVLFWDEIDSIGCKRGGSGSLSHENDRITNSVLVNIDKLKEDVIFIAATNRAEELDSAFVRRFDVKFEVLPPKDYFAKQAFAKKLIDYYKMDIPIETLDFNSYSEIKNFIAAKVRTMIYEEIKNKPKI